MFFLFTSSIVNLIFISNVGFIFSTSALVQSGLNFSFDLSGWVTVIYPFSTLPRRLSRNTLVLSLSVRSLEPPSLYVNSWTTCHFGDSILLKADSHAFRPSLDFLGMFLFMILIAFAHSPPFTRPLSSYGFMFFFFASSIASLIFMSNVRFIFSTSALRFFSSIERDGVSFNLTFSANFIIMLFNQIKYSIHDYN